MNAELSFHNKVLAIQQELKVGKNRRNKFGNYNYRSLEDIMDAVKPLLKQYDLTLFFSDEIISGKGMDYRTPTSVKVGKEFVLDYIGTPMFVTSTVTLMDGEDGKIAVSASAGIDVSKTGMDMAQSFGSSSSYARKYAANGLFLIDDTQDSDATNTHGKAPVKAKPKAKVKVECATTHFNELHKYLKSSKEPEVALGKMIKKYNITPYALTALKELVNGE